jgi:hypothetical protein
LGYLNFFFLKFFFFCKQNLAVHGTDPGVKTVITTCTADVRQALRTAENRSRAAKECFREVSNGFYKNYSGRVGDEELETNLRERHLQSPFFETTVTVNGKYVC